MLALARMMQVFKEISTNQGNLISDVDYEVGTEVYVTDDEGNIVLAPSATYETDNMVYVVENGIITAIEQKDFEPVPVVEDEEEKVKEEEVVKAEEEEQPAEEEEIPTEEEEVDEEKEALKAENESLKAEIKALKEQIKTLEEELAKPVDEPIEKEEGEFKKEKKKDEFEHFRKVANFKLGK